MKLLFYFVILTYLQVVFTHVITKRVDVSYASPAYKYCECGRKNIRVHENNRIVGGHESQPNEYPWMALIAVIENAIPQLVCGGSLISDQYIITAAHCLRSKYAQSQMKVILGEHDLCSPDIRTVTFSIDKLIQHPKYISSKRLMADVMLVKLNMRVTFNAYIRPICLPSAVGKKNAELRFGGRLGDILGWGVGDTLNVSCSLRETSIIIFKPEKCNHKAFYLFCAGHPEGNRDACAGDSGGPLQLINSKGKFELIGIIASGIACGDKEAPGLYTDVVRVLSWIYDTSKDSMYCWR